MKISLSFIAILLLPISLFGQNKNDYIWQMGYNPNDPDGGFGGTSINFNDDSDSPETNYFDIPFDFLATTSCSDNEGNLVFYANGCQIANRNHEIMENGSNINAGDAYDTYCEGGYPSIQGVLSLQLPGSDSIYYLFHIKRNDENVTINGNLLKTIININAENNNGIVLSKNELVLESEFTEELSAVKHGNGRDWWIILPERLSNKIFVFLFSPLGIQFSHEQEIGISWEYAAQIGQATFSPDGTKFIRANVKDNIHIYDFDRCTGFFDNPIHFDIPVDTFKTASVGCSVSPNSRFLYISAFVKIHQYDLNALNIEASKVTVGEYDGYQSPFATTFFQGMLAPDDKIYWTCTNGNDVLHVIHNPNGTGTNCDFENHGFQMPNYHTFQVPNFPYFRLYDVQGSVCDTLGINDPVATEEIFNELKPLDLYPNPAKSAITVTLIDGFSGTLALFDMAGKQMQQKVRAVGGQTDFSLANVVTGIYLVVATDEKTGKMWQEKLVVQR